MSVLVDTNVLSELSRPRPDVGVQAWSRTVTRVAVSAITVDEVVYGLAWRPNPRVEEWFDSFLASHCDVLPVTAQIARHAGHLRGTMRAHGRQRTQADMLIAATAMLHGLTLVSRNVGDFDGCGIALLNPFS